MKKAIPWFVLLFGLLIIVIHIPNTGELKSVLYGERPAIFDASKSTSRWFFDKEGNLYPSVSIPDSLLSECQGSLKEYFFNNQKRTIDLAADYGFAIDHFDEESFSDFQDSLIAEKVEEVNLYLRDSASVFVLVHGFRKPMISNSGSTSSFSDYQVLKSVINATTGKDHYFIEVYWDGTYDTFEPTKRDQHFESFKLFENEARTNAVFAGYGLRKLISKLKSPQVNIVSHSLGARVVLSALFNTYDEYVDSEIQKRITPSQNQVNICLLAPAISNRPFEEYYDRMHTYPLQENENYKCTILYNEEDIILLKRWVFLGPGPRKYGDTSLGCNYEGAATQLKEIFEEKYPNSELQILNTKIGNSHMMEHYALSDNFKLFLEGL